ncbi:response regulator transcription factor [Arcobacter cloacae]|uniref:Helix-turn-helix transcriptional regulator n=1 Tax=Arcobacter cloacae TaxID=1054034 RepID=A0A6M8NKU4_9BACT|nr:response regulator transcription factor [Arcobacter cloacae]QKF91179.1 DNA-binding response regulator, NarL/FixJ family [Arcobacter cloacae]RXI40445.1 helix-turn-helix transcriptional regulator [Arcobacter cloacae]
MKRVYLFSDDLLLIGRWVKLINHQTSIVEHIEDLENIKNSILIVNSSNCKDISTKFINDFIKNENQILVLDNTPNLMSAKRFLSLGIRGYGNTLMTTSYLNSAIDAISNNYVWLIPQITTLLLRDMAEKNDIQIDEEKLFEILTKTERKIAELLKNGYSNIDISNELEISINTVKTHIKHIYEKLNVKDRFSFANLFSK